MADNDVRQRRNARRRILYRMQRAAETPAETVERRLRHREYMRRRTNISSDEQRRINREYTQRRRANNASEERQHTDHAPFILSGCSNILMITSQNKSTQYTILNKTKLIMRKN